MRSYWGGWGRTSNLPVNSRALCQLSYTPRWNCGIVTLLAPGKRGKARTHMPLRAHALILAAGQSRRFGGGKLYAPYRGRPLLSYVLEVVRVARTRGLLDGGHIVVAADDERGLTLAHAAGLDAIINPAPDLGISHSLQLGLAALEASPRAEAALVFLGDQPLVRLDVVEALVAAGNSQIVRPRYESHPDAPGHPVLLPRSIWERARQLEGDHGFRDLVSSLPGTVGLDVKGDNPDIDTRADLKALEGLSR
jgi:molybdenum cofactor cytidylyltransferase